MLDVSYPALDLVGVPQDLLLIREVALRLRSSRNKAHNSISVGFNWKHCNICGEMHH